MKVVPKPALAVGLAAVAALTLSGCGGSAGSGFVPPVDTTTTTTVTTTTTTIVCDKYCNECTSADGCTTCAEGFDAVDGKCLYKCSSDYTVNLVEGTKKGITIDDTTQHYCPELMPYKWPHTQESVGSIRLFQAWRADWKESALQKASLKATVDFAKASKVKVLVGTPLTCSEEDDDESWRQVKDLLAQLGAENVMGLMIGNEMEQLQDNSAMKDAAGQNCLRRLWGTKEDMSDGYILQKINEYVADLDTMPGFESIPITSAMTGAMFAGNRFKNTPFSRCYTLFKQVTEVYKDRWIFSLNVYPYFDPNQRLDAGTTNQCHTALTASTCFLSSGCVFTDTVVNMRRIMASEFGTNYKLWITENGWSTPMSKTLNTQMVHCPSWSMEDSFKQYYRNFMSWDLSIPNLPPPDHVFYHTVRDAANFAHVEHLGLVGDCWSNPDDPPETFKPQRQCKLQQDENGEPEMVL